MMPCQEIAAALPLMIRAYYTQAPAQMMEGERWADAYRLLLGRLPEQRAEALRRNRHKQTRLNSSLGLLLLGFAMRQNGAADFELRELDYAPNRKPACPGRHPFNISHSHELAICAVNTGDTEPVGIDVEYIRTMDASKFTEYVSSEELKIAGNGTHPFIS
jgi:phosphopantetheinyl transferase